MEDAHCHELSVDDDPNTSYFAVYDGHGGDQVSKYVNERLYKIISEQPAFKDGKYEDAIRGAFLAMDDDTKAKFTGKNGTCSVMRIGTTAVVVLIKDKRLYIGNSGDSRAIACIRGKCDPWSVDHKPDAKLERKRIAAAGSYVTDKRINGMIAVSRAFGKCSNHNHGVKINH